METSNLDEKKEISQFLKLSILETLEAKKWLSF